MTKPLISIVIPSYNGAPYLQRCLDSIFAQVCAELNFEVICVDDASSDDSLAMLQAYACQQPIRIIALEKNAGPAQATVIPFFHHWFAPPKSAATLTRRANAKASTVARLTAGQNKSACGKINSLHCQKNILKNNFCKFTPHAQKYHENNQENYK